LQVRATSLHHRRDREIHADAQISFEVRFRPARLRVVRSLADRDPRPWRAGTLWC